MKQKELQIKRGDVIYVNLGQHPKSSVQSGYRPCIVVSNNKSNRFSTVYNVIPCTGRIKENNPVHVKLMPSDVSGYLEKISDAMAEQIVTVDRVHVTGKVGFVPPDSEAIHLINQAIIKQYGLENEVRYMAEQMVKEGMNLAEEGGQKEVC